MAKKKKSSSNNKNDPPQLATAVQQAEPATSSPPTPADAEFETEMELQQIDTGDMVKLKQVLDETVAGTFSDLDLKEDHYLDNIKLSLMTLACLFAMVAQFAPVPFPESRPMLGVCCCLYFALSGLLQFISTAIDRDAIMLTRPCDDDDVYGKKNSDMKKYGLRIRTSLPRFDEFFTLVIEFQGLKNSPYVKQTWSVGKFFDVEGMFDEIGLMEEVYCTFKRFEKGDYDKDTELDEKKKQ